MPYSEITKLALADCDVVSNNYQQNSRVFYTFVPNKSFGQLLDIFPEKFIFLKTFNSEFYDTAVWFTDQNFSLLQIEYKINITRVIN